MTNSVFSQFQRSNNLDASQLDDVVNQAFTELSSRYAQFDLEYDEDGVSITNFDNCTDEETGGNTKEQVEGNLTDELLRISETKI